MTDMVERVARAIRASDQIDLPDDFCGVVDGDIRFGRALFQARAAIAAMRDPDHDMTGAVLAPCVDRTSTVRSWNKMIDAALGEKK